MATPFVLLSKNARSLTIGPAFNHPTIDGQAREVDVLRDIDFRMPMIQQVNSPLLPPLLNRRRSTFRSLLISPPYLNRPLALRPPPTSKLQPLLHY